MQERLDRLTEQVAALTRVVGRLQEQWGLAHEEMAQELVPDILRRKGWTVHRVAPLQYNGEMDVVVEAEAGGRAFTLAVEVKGRVWGRGPMQDVLDRLQDPDFLAATRRAGFREPIVPAVFGLIIYLGAEEAARQLGVGLLSPRGELVEPRHGLGTAEG